MRHTPRCLPEYRVPTSKHPTHVPAIKILALPWCPGHVARTVARRGMALTPYAFTSVAVQSGRRYRMVRAVAEGRAHPELIGTDGTACRAHPESSKLFVTRGARVAVRK